MTLQSERLQQIVDMLAYPLMRKRITVIEKAVKLRCLCKPEQICFMIVMRCHRLLKIILCRKHDHIAVCQCTLREDPAHHFSGMLPIAFRCDHAKGRTFLHTVSAS